MTSCRRNHSPRHLWRWQNLPTTADRAADAETVGAALNSWQRPPDVRWTDDEGTSVGREALEAKARALQSQMHGLVFTKASPVYQTRGFGYLACKLGPEGGDPVASGFDVAIVRNERISELYTVITT